MLSQQMPHTTLPSQSAPDPPDPHLPTPCPTTLHSTSSNTLGSDRHSFFTPGRHPDAYPVPSLSSPPTVHPTVDLHTVQHAMQAHGQPLQLADLAHDVVLINAKYGNYLQRQQKEILEFNRNQHMRIPANLDYSQFNALSAEEVEKLKKQLANGKGGTAADALTIYGSDARAEVARRVAERM